MAEYVEVQQDQQWANDLQQQVQLGIDAEKFMGTKLGQYLEQCAIDSAIAAMGKLKTVDPKDEVAIRALQNAVFRAESFSFWIDQCIKNGLSADDQLQEQG